MKILFYGGGTFAAQALRRLVDARHEVMQVIAPPPRAAGRKMKLMPCATQAAAEQLRLSVAHAADAQILRAAEAAVVCDYGRILPQKELDVAGVALNIHPSLLPRWRGAAPIERALLAGDAETGVTIMRMTARLDAGAIVRQWRMPLDQDMNAAKLREVLCERGCDMLLQALADLRTAAAPYKKDEAQDDARATYARKIVAAERELDFAGSALACWRQVLAFCPAPGAFFWADGERVRVIGAALAGAEAASDLQAAGEWRPDADALLVKCGEGALRLTHLQRAGRRAASAAEFLRGWRGSARFAAGEGK